MRRKRAVLAVAAAGPRKRQREVPAERDATAHALWRFYGRRLLALILCAGTIGACGSGTHHTPRDAALVLDFTPNAVHAGIYSALAHGYDKASGLRLHVVAPTQSTDSIKLLQTGRVDFAILDIHDLAIARERGADVVGFMAIVERPLAAVLAGGAVANPRQLEGGRVGITGVPSDTAVLDSIVDGAGGNRRRLHTINIGFNAVPALLSGKVTGAIGFWNDEGVTLSRRRPGYHSFRVDAYGAPRYPELVLCATGSTLRQNPALAMSVVRALTLGYQFTLENPQESATELERQVPGLDPSLVAVQLRSLLPVFRGPRGRVGELANDVLDRWSVWEARFGIVRRRPDVQATFAPSFVTKPTPSRAIRERGTTSSNPA